MSAFFLRIASGPHNAGVSGNLIAYVGKSAAGYDPFVYQRGMTANEVEISEDVLYRARITIPSRVPVGTYTAETFLLSGGRVIAVATRDVTIGKTGFERFVTLSAERHPFFYGLASVAISLALGWIAAMAFRRTS